MDGDRGDLRLRGRDARDGRVFVGERNSMKALTHYIVVRRDLPIGAIIANVAHAAGESFYQLACLSSSEKERAASEQDDRTVAGLSPASGSTFNPAETIVVVLGARNEQRLAKLEASLRAAAIPHVAIREPESPYNGGLVAIGLVPAERDTVRRYINDFHMLPTEQMQQVAS